MKMKRQEISAALLGVMIALILWLTILGRETQVGGVSFYKPFHSIGHLMKDIQRSGLRGNFIGNLVLFIPIGLLVPIMTGWNKRTIAVGAIFSIFIETIQLITSRGVFDPDDVLLNTIGCVIGYFIFRSARKLIIKSD